MKAQRELCRRRFFANKLLLGHQDTLLDRNRGGFCAATHLQLCDDVPDVVSDGEMADLDGSADFLIS
jgi:hypothetical protein